MRRNPYCFDMFDVELLLFPSGDLIEVILPKRRDPGHFRNITWLPVDFGMVQKSPRGKNCLSGPLSAGSKEAQNYNLFSLGETSFRG